MARTRPSTVFITGASSGIGRALAYEYARGGAQLALAARRADELEVTLQGVRQRGGSGLTIPLDVTVPAQVREAVERADRELGGLDMVVANAGFGDLHHASRVQFSDIAPMIRTNVDGAMATLLAAVPIMMARASGHLVGISSLAGRRALPESAAYCASKAALSAFLESLRIDSRARRHSSHRRSARFRRHRPDRSRQAPDALRVDARARRERHRATPRTRARGDRVPVASRVSHGPGSQASGLAVRSRRARTLRALFAGFLAREKRGPR